MWLDLLRRRRGAYVRTFEGESGRIVLSDLARFCHSQATTHVPGDTHGSSQLEGRRQVWLRVQKHLFLTEAQINHIMQEAEE